MQLIPFPIDLYPWGRNDLVEGQDRLEKNESPTQQGKPRCLVKIATQQGDLCQVGVEVSCPLVPLPSCDTPILVSVALQ